MPRIVTVTSLLVLIFGACLFADNVLDNRKSLKGLKQFRVVIEDVKNDAMNDGLTVDQLFTQTST